MLRLLVFLTLIIRPPFFIARDLAKPILSRQPHRQTSLGRVLAVDWLGRLHRVPGLPSSSAPPTITGFLRPLPMSYNACGSTEHYEAQGWAKIGLVSFDITVSYQRDENQPLPCHCEFKLKHRSRRCFSITSFGKGIIVQQRNPLEPP